MDLRQLEVFAGVYELRSFSRTASALRLTQSTVSEHVRLLEEELGTRLFDRLSRETVPTRAGELLYGYARQMLALRTEARQALDQFLGQVTGTLLVGASTIPGEYVLPGRHRPLPRAAPPRGHHAPDLGHARDRPGGPGRPGRRGRRGGRPGQPRARGAGPDAGRAGPRRPAGTPVERPPRGHARRAADRASDRARAGLGLAPGARARAGGGRAEPRRDAGHRRDGLDQRHQAGGQGRRRRVHHVEPGGRGRVPARPPGLREAQGPDRHAPLLRGHPRQPLALAALPRVPRVPGESG